MWRMNRLTAISLLMATVPATSTFAQPIEQQQNFFFLLSPGTDTLTFDQFDDMGGTRQLQRVTLSIEGTAEAVVSLTNISPNQAQIMIDPQDTTVAVTELMLGNLATLPTVVININDTINCGFNLAPGQSCDFGSSLQNPLQFGPQSASQSLELPADLSAFIGTGQVNGTVDGVGNFQYTGSILFNLTVPLHQGLGVATLTYEFLCLPQACCFPDGSCQDLCTPDCTDAGGTPQGAGTTCANTDCPGACCLANQQCVDGITRDDCEGQGGTFQGFGLTCQDIECEIVCVDTDKGSLLIYSKVEIRWANAGGNNFNVVQDTYIDLANDWPGDVRVQMFFVNGDPPLDASSGERAHPGWNWVDNEITLTKNEPTYWSVLTGAPKGVSPFTVLDPTGLGGPGRPDPAGSDDRVLRGYIIAFAVDMITNEEIKWNHLKGDATIVNYRDPSVWEYLAWAFEAPGPGNTGDLLGTPGMLMLDGSEYACVYEQLLLDFYAVGSPALSGGNPFNFISVDTDVTLFPVSADLQQESAGPVTTKAHYDVWNMNEVKFSGAFRCITCWDQTLLSAYGVPNHFLLGNLQTNKGKARIDGLGSQLCPGSVNAAILGVAAKLLDFNFGAGSDAAGMNLFGMGREDAVIKYDPVAPPPPVQESDNADDPVIRLRDRGLEDRVN